MENVGTWNSDFVVMLVLLMLAPVCIAFLVKIIVFLSEATAVHSQDPSPTYEDVKNAALRKAADGDRYARDWCSKNVFSNSTHCSQSVQSQPKSKPDFHFLTSKEIMQDTVQALIAVGYKKNDAQSLVAHFATQKKYSEVGTMFLEIIKTNQK